MARLILYRCFSGLDPSFSMLKKKPPRVDRWLCSPVQGPRLFPSVGHNRTFSFTWRREQSQFPKLSGFEFSIVNGGSSPEKQQYRTSEHICDASQILFFAVLLCLSTPVGSQGDFYCVFPRQSNLREIFTVSFHASRVSGRFCFEKQFNLQRS
jgi:hypothetical protein